MIDVDDRVTCQGIDSQGTVLSLIDQGYVVPMATIRFDDDDVPTVVDRWRLAPVSADLPKDDRG